MHSGYGLAVPDVRLQPEQQARLAIDGMLEAAGWAVQDYRATAIDLGARRGLRNMNVQWGSFDLQDVKEMRITDGERERFRVRQGDLLVCEGERNSLLISYDAGTDSYRYSDGPYGITDGDGAGGCSPGPGIGQATCPAAIVNHINISLLDGDDTASLTGTLTGSLTGSFGTPLTQVTVGATIEGGDGNDFAIRGGAGNDLLSGGPGNDNLFGETGDDTLLGGEGNDALAGDGGCTGLQPGHPCSTFPPPTGGPIASTGVPGWTGRPTASRAPCSMGRCPSASTPHCRDRT